MTAYSSHEGQKTDNREMEIALQRSNDIVIRQKNQIDSLVSKMTQMQSQIDTLAAKLNYYENPNSPPSSDSLAWKQEKQERRQKRRDDDTQPKRPGGREGHTGHQGDTIRKEPYITVFKTLPDATGSVMVTTGSQTRDILDMQVTTTETRHITQKIRCPSCNITRHAPNDLPVRGSYGKNIAGLIIQLRASKMPFGSIPEIILNTLGIHISKSTAINTVYRIADVLESSTQEIISQIQNSDQAHVDETTYTYNGRLTWVWGLVSGKHIAMIMNPSRGAFVLDRYLDRYLDGYDGTVISDGYPVYKRFDPGGRHQICWARELRNAKDVAKKYGGVAEKLYADLHPSLRDQRK